MLVRDHPKILIGEVYGYEIHVVTINSGIKLLDYYCVFLYYIVYPSHRRISTKIYVHVEKSIQL